MRNALARMASLSEGAGTALLGGNIVDQQDLFIRLSYDAPMPPGSHMTVLNIKLYLFARSVRSHHRSRSSTNPETSSPVLFWRLVQATEHGHGELQLQRHLHAR
jgi:hypothetical protein